MSNLTMFLRPEHTSIGLTLQDDDKSKEIYLQKDGSIIRTFGRYATLVEIHHAADQLIEQSKSGITFEKVK